MSEFIKKMRNIPRNISDVILKSRARNPAYVMVPEPTVRFPPRSLGIVYPIADNSWILQEIYKVLIQEAKRPGWRILPRFKTQCKVCKLEFETTVEDCPMCGKGTLEPDITQLPIIQNIIRKPNPDDKLSFGDIIGSTIYHDQVGADSYISVLPKLKGNGDLVPAQLTVEHSAFIGIVSDELNRLGIDEWYCPICYIPDVTYDKNQFKQFNGVCPIDGFKLHRTAYIQKIGGEIKNRWSTKLMVHGSTNRILPSLFGRPKIFALWEPIHIVEAMDFYNVDVYTEGHDGMILNFPGYSIEDITALKLGIEEENEKLKKTSKRGMRTKRSLRTIFMGSEKPISKISTMPDLAAMQSLQFYMLHIQAIAGLHGVVPLFLGLEIGEKRGTSTGQPYIKLEVQNRTLQEIHRDKEEMFNEQLWPIFGVTDWVLKFNQVEVKDNMRLANIYNTKVTSLITLRNAGIDAQFNELGEIVIKSYTMPVEEIEGDEEDFDEDEDIDEDEDENEKKPKRRVGESGPGFKVSESTGGVINDTTSERHPSGPRGKPK